MNNQNKTIINNNYYYYNKLARIYIILKWLFFVIVILPRIKLIIQERLYILTLYQDNIISEDTGSRSWQWVGGWSLIKYQLHQKSTTSKKGGTLISVVSQYITLIANNM